jgi:O-antigen ligase
MDGRTPVLVSESGRAHHPHRPDPMRPLAAVIVVVWQAVESPAALLAIIVALIALPAPDGARATGLRVTAPDIGFALLFLVVGARLLLASRGLRLLRSAVVLPVVAVLLAGGLSVIGARDPAASAPGLVRSAELYVLGPLAVAMSLRTRRDVKILLAALVALGALEALVGTYQYLTGKGAGFAGGSQRAVGTFGAYDIMAMSSTVAVAIAVTVAVALVAEGRLRLVATVATGLFVPALLFTLSRGALLATSAGVLAVLIIGRRQRVLAMGVAVAVALPLTAAVVLGPASLGTGVVGSRVASISNAVASPDQSVQDRYALWSAAWAMFREQPVTGIGVKGFAGARDSHSPLNLSTGSDISDPVHGYRRVALLSPHSLYLLVLSEQGMVGALAYGALYLTVLVAGARRLRRGTHEPLHALVGYAALGAVVSQLVDSISSDPGGSTAAFVPLVVGLALWWASGAAFEEVS